MSSAEPWASRSGREFEAAPEARFERRPGVSGGPAASSTAPRHLNELSTKVEDCPFLVENRVDAVPRHAVVSDLRTSVAARQWVTAFARGLGKPDRGPDWRGKTWGRRVREDSASGAARYRTAGNSQ